MPYRIVVGLPSCNEADTIAKVTTDLDAALTTLPFRHEAMIVNADNSSIDGTSDIFAATATRSGKRVITTPPRAGKGTNWRAVLALATAEGADAVLFVDTDLAEVPAIWVHTLLGGVRDGHDFCYPLRPPTWNGGDLTYHLAYPLLAGVFGADLREPFCGEIALSGHAATDLSKATWTEVDLGFGADFLAATVAVSHRWRAVELRTRRRNKLRSFTTTTTGGDYRMGAKFRENSVSIGHRCALRLRTDPPQALTSNAESAPFDSQFVVPREDDDLAALATSTSRRLRADAAAGAFGVFTPGLAARLYAHATDTPERGMTWDLWRSCLFEWIAQIASEGDVVDPELLETLFLSRVVGHHSEIAGTCGWYTTVIDQAHDTFRHRAQLWAMA